MYNPSVHKKTNSFGFGKSSRTNFVPKGQQNTPGPGSYLLPSRVAEVPSYETSGKQNEFKFV